MKKYFLLIFLFLGYLSPNLKATVLPQLAHISSQTAQNVYFVHKIQSKMPLTTAEKWKKAGFIILFIIGVLLIILGLVLLVDLAKNNFDGGHLGWIPTAIVAIILGLGGLLSVFSGKKLKKLKA